MAGMDWFGFGKRQKVIDSVFGSSSGPKEDYSIFDSNFLKDVGLGKDSANKLGKLVSEMRNKTLNRKERYQEYKNVARDPVVGQAIEMMADDATQFDVERTKTVWVECDDKEYQNAINGIIEDYLEPFIDNVASSILSKGEFAFKINKGENKRGKYSDLILIPYKYVERLHHLILPNQERYFYEVEDIQNVSGSLSISEKFRNFEEFLHFINYSIENSDEVNLDVSKGDKKEIIEVFVLQGESILTDKILETFRILQSIEDALIQYRMAKSKLVRFVNVDVTRLTDNAKAQAIVNYVHGAIAVNEAIDESRYNVTTSQSAPVILTIPTKNGVGNVTVSEFNSDVNIKDVADLDYFLNKVFAGLRTPKSFFNFMEAMPGMGGASGSLMRSDVRYARAVKKVQRVIVNGVKELVWVFNKVNGISNEENPPVVNIKIVKAASAEDVEKYLDFDARIESASRMVGGILDPSTGEVNAKVVGIYIQFFTYVTPNAELVSFLKSLLNKASVVSKPTQVKIGKVLKSSPEE